MDLLPTKFLRRSERLAIKPSYVTFVFNGDICNTGQLE